MGAGKLPPQVCMPVPSLWYGGGDCILMPPALAKEIFRSV
jgi:hypothetical protein